MKNRNSKPANLFCTSSSLLHCSIYNLQQKETCLYTENTGKYFLTRFHSTEGHLAMHPMLNSLLKGLKIVIYVFESDIFISPFTLVRHPRRGYIHLYIWDIPLTE